VFVGLSETIEIGCIFVATVFGWSSGSSSSAIFEEIFPVCKFPGRFVRSAKSVDLRFDYLALVGVVRGVFSVVHTKKLAGIVVRVARLQGALPARGLTAKIWHSRGVLVYVIVDAFGDFEAFAEFQEFVNGSLDWFESMHNHFLLPPVGDAKVKMFCDFVVIEFVRRTLFVK